MLLLFQSFVSINTGLNNKILSETKLPSCSYTLILSRTLGNPSNAQGLA